MKSLLICLILLTQGTAFATTTTESTAVNKQVVKKKKLNSSEYREGKKASISLGFGISIGEGSQSLSTEYFIDADSHITLRGSYGDDDESDGDSDEQFSFELGFKQFVSNSFYLNPTLYYRDFTRSITRYDSTDDIDKQVNEGYTDIGMGIAIGNQWQFKTLTIGCDWFGLSRSVIDLKKTPNYDIDDLAINFLNFYIGMSF